MAIQFQMACGICGELVTLSPQRYRQYSDAGQRPVCRRNGCEQLCGRSKLDIARTSELRDVPGVAGMAIVSPPQSGGDVEPLLARWRAKHYSERS